MMTDQEQRRMSVLASTRAGNKSALLCNLVDQVVGQQKIQRTVDRRWYRALIAFLQPIEELIGGDRHLGLNDEFQHRTPQGGELGTSACASFGCDFQSLLDARLIYWGPDSDRHYPLHRPQVI
jgi:hypothetical protein